MASEKVQLKGKRILLVDDDRINVFALTAVLESYELDIIDADGGKKAIEILQKTDDIELVLMDMRMPDMDGFQAIQLIRKEARFKNLPIIGLTAQVMPGDREKVIRAGANDYHPKPVDTALLIGQISDLLSAES